jgi:hypothetical protein
MVGATLSFCFFFFPFGDLLTPSSGFCIIQSVICVLLIDYLTVYHHISQSFLRLLYSLFIIPKFTMNEGLLSYNGDAFQNFLLASVPRQKA